MAAIKAKYQRLQVTSEEKSAAIQSLMALVWPASDRENCLPGTLYYVVLKEWVKPSQSFHTSRFRLYVVCNGHVTNISKLACQAMGWYYSSDDMACEASTMAVSNADDLRYELYKSIEIANGYINVELKEI